MKNTHDTIIRYALYDARANYDKFRATCYSVCDTLKDARQEKREDFDDAVIFKEELHRQKDGSYLVVKSELVK